MRHRPDGSLVFGRPCKTMRRGPRGYILLCMMDPVRDSVVGRVEGVADPIADALAGAIYPLSRTQLVELARENEASTAVLSRLAALPNREFRSQTQVTDSVAAR